MTDRLALQRTRLANEGTLFTYVRTSLALVGFGLALLQFHLERGGRLGTTALSVAAVVLAIGLLRFRAHRRELLLSATCRKPLGPARARNTGGS